MRRRPKKKDNDIKRLVAGIVLIHWVTLVTPVVPTQTLLPPPICIWFLFGQPLEYGP
jgi:hypothetical protein